MTGVADPDAPGSRPPARSRLCRLGDEVLLAISVVLDEDDRPRSARVEATGELCALSAPELEAVLLDLLEQGVREIHIDLSGLRTCTAAGIAVFARIRRRLEQMDRGRLRLAGARGAVKTVLDLTGLDHDGGHHEGEAEVVG